MRSGECDAERGDALVRLQGVRAVLGAEVQGEGALLALALTLAVLQRELRGGQHRGQRAPGLEPDVPGGRPAPHRVQEYLTTTILHPHRLHLLTIVVYTFYT